MTRPAATCDPSKAITIPDEVLEKWQRIVEIIADILHVPTVIITRIEAQDLKALRTNAAPENPIKEGYAFPLGGEDLFRGIYCEWVIKEKQNLIISDASSNEAWHRSLGSRFGLVSYIGLPLLMPDGAVFGSICAMDFKTDRFDHTYELLLAHFKDLIESHLHLLTQQSTLTKQVAQLEAMEAELLSYGEQLEEQVSRRTKELADTNTNLLREIAERSRTARALSESEERFRHLVETSLTGIAILSQAGIRYQNPEHRRLLGPLPERSLEAYLDTIHPGDRDQVQQQYRGILAGDIATLNLDYRLQPSGTDGPPSQAFRWVQCRASRIVYDGETAVFLNLMDITRTKELEQLMRIEDKMSSLGRVAAGIAHEIRNPLSAMNMYLKAARTAVQSSDAPAFVGAVDMQTIFGKLQTAVDKIEAIIKRVMDFSKPAVPLLTATNINRAVEKAVELSAVTVRKAGVQIETHLCAELPDCLADAQMIEQVLLNLITNASEVLADGKGTKKIRISSEATPWAIVTRVSDSGVGVPAALRDTIFDPFFTTRKAGSGIGLSLVRRIIIDHGGSLEVAASDWGGAEFIFKIPLNTEETRR
ncbi:MAG: ATP-binding protein [Desulfosarcinaceae bacterium]|nr:ATP-binding protein [Desulfosarcinaceae bacterium]